MTAAALLARVKKLEASRRTAPTPSANDVDPAAYPQDPVEYARDVLRVGLTPDQEEIIRSLLEPPCKVLVPSAHNVGKTFVAAVAANWWFDSFRPGLVLSTAPTERDVVDLLWTEIRLQRQRAGLPSRFTGPRSPEMRDAEDHYAKGYTARKGESFQGRHRPRMLFIFDEANGIEPIYWESTRSMFDPSLGHAWLAIYNPTTTTSQAYIEANTFDDDGPGRWKLIRLSATNHPNLAAELDGLPKPVPSAVGLRQFQEEWLKEWCEPVRAGDEKATDFAWPPRDWCEANNKTPALYRPGPIFQGRALGMDPDTGAGVWSEPLWQACVTPRVVAYPLNQLPQLGADMATGKGDDYFAALGRWGPFAVCCETANTMDAVAISERLERMAADLAALCTKHRPPAAEPVRATKIPMKLDDDGTGSAVGAILRRKGYAVTLVGAGTKALRPDLYPRRRDELWFATAEKAKRGEVHLGQLDRAALRRLKQQLMAPEWGLDGQGKRKVEPKDDTKEKIGRSPDDADALNLAYYDAPSQAPQAVEPAPRSTGGRGGHFSRGRR